MFESALELHAAGLAEKSRWSLCAYAANDVNYRHYIRYSLNWINTVYLYRLLLAPARACKASLKEWVVAASYYATFNFMYEIP